MKVFWEQILGISFTASQIHGYSQSVGALGTTFRGFTVDIGLCRFLTADTQVQIRIQ